jgi:hypothetical protein
MFQMLLLEADFSRAERAICDRLKSQSKKKKKKNEDLNCSVSKLNYSFS